MTLQSILEELRANWSSPTPAKHFGHQIPFRLRCRFSRSPAAVTEIGEVPEDLRAFWRQAESATLFEDVDFGQWGIEILSPESAREETRRSIRERPDDFVETDLVVGRFLGDSDQLVVRADQEKPDFGEVFVALPLDKRTDWYRLGLRFSGFLRRLAEEQGAKFWEPHD